jgi:hypothetical protein
MDIRIQVGSRQGTLDLPLPQNSITLLKTRLYEVDWCKDEVDLKQVG